MPRYAAAIFDLDGTLIGTERILVDTCIDTLASYGHIVTRDFVTSMVGVSEVEGFRRICAHINVALDPVEFGAAWSRANQIAYAKGIPLMPGVADLLALLKAQAVPVAVATNSSTAGAWRKLRLAGIGDAFEVVIGFDAVPLAKPAPDVFLAAAAGLNVAPADCIAFEDSDPGVAAALAAGMTVVHVPDMALPRQIGAHHLAGSILDGARAAGLIS
jgi:HAD superfamily hydrolase (TIGR01509 family)